MKAKVLFLSLIIFCLTSISYSLKAQSQIPGHSYEKLRAAHLKKMHKAHKRGVRKVYLSQEDHTVARMRANYKRSLRAMQGKPVVKPRRRGHRFYKSNNS